MADSMFPDWFAINPAFREYFGYLNGKDDKAAFASEAQKVENDPTHVPNPALFHEPDKYINPLHQFKAAVNESYKGRAEPILDRFRTNGGETMADDGMQSILPGAVTTAAERQNPYVAKGISDYTAKRRNESDLSDYYAANQKGVAIDPNVAARLAVNSGNLLDNYLKVSTDQEKLNALAREKEKLANAANLELAGANLLAPYGREIQMGDGGGSRVFAGGKQGQYQPGTDILSQFAAINADNPVATFDKSHDNLEKTMKESYYTDPTPKQWGTGRTSEKYLLEKNRYGMGPDKMLNQVSSTEPVTEPLLPGQLPPKQELSFQKAYTSAATEAMRRMKFNATNPIMAMMAAMQTNPGQAPTLMANAESAMSPADRVKYEGLKRQLFHERAPYFKDIYDQRVGAPVAPVAPPANRPPLSSFNEKGGGKAGVAEAAGPKAPPQAPPPAKVVAPAPLSPQDRGYYARGKYIPPVGDLFPGEVIKRGRRTNG